jgi:hypothetical protein
MTNHDAEGWFPYTQGDQAPMTRGYALYTKHASGFVVAWQSTTDFFWLDMNDPIVAYRICSDEPDGWIHCAGKPCPFPRGTLVDIYSVFGRWECGNDAVVCMPECGAWGTQIVRCRIHRSAITKNRPTVDGTQCAMQVETAPTVVGVSQLDPNDAMIDRDERNETDREWLCRIAAEITADAYQWPAAAPLAPRGVLTVAPMSGFGCGPVWGACA